MNAIAGFSSEQRVGPPAPTQRIQPVSTPAPMADQPAARTDAGNGALAKQVTVDLPEITAGKLSLSVDDKTGRVVGRVVDRKTGEVLWQVPSEDMLRLIAATDALLGPLYSTEA